MQLEERVAKQLRDVLMGDAKVELVERGTLLGHQEVAEGHRPATDLG